MTRDEKRVLRGNHLFASLPSFPFSTDIRRLCASTQNTFLPFIPHFGKQAASSVCVKRALCSRGNQRPADIVSRGNRSFGRLGVFCFTLEPHLDVECIAVNLSGWLLVEGRPRVHNKSQGRPHVVDVVGGPLPTRDGMVVLDPEADRFKMDS